MADLTFTAVVDETRVLTLPPEAPLGEIEVVLRPREGTGNGAALLRALRASEPIDDPDFFQRAQEELLRSREED